MFLVSLQGLWSYQIFLTEQYCQRIEFFQVLFQLVKLLNKLKVIYVEIREVFGKQVSIS